MSVQFIENITGQKSNNLWSTIRSKHEAARGQMNHQTHWIPSINFHFIRRWPQAFAHYSLLNIATSTSLWILLLTFIPILYWIRYFLIVVVILAFCCCCCCCSTSIIRSNLNTVKKSVFHMCRQKSKVFLSTLVASTVMHGTCSRSYKMGKQWHKKKTASNIIHLQ